jgi:DNA-binding CsgD family transcriptional regulator
MTIKAELINPDRLTTREAEIAVLMAEGQPNKIIASLLAISIRTVDQHISTIYLKMGLRQKSINTRCTAILMMVARGMITLSIRSVILVLVFNAMQLDNHALRVRSGRNGGSQTSRFRDTDA